MFAVCIQPGNDDTWHFNHSFIYSFISLKHTCRHDGYQLPQVIRWTTVIKDGVRNVICKSYREHCGGDRLGESDPHPGVDEGRDSAERFVDVAILATSSRDRKL